MAKASTTAAPFQIEELEGRAMLAGPGGTLATALNLGPLVNSQSFAEAIGAKQADYYKFSTSTKGNFNLTLDRLTSDANVQLLNSTGNVKYASAKTGAATERVSALLNKGTYYVRVLGANNKAATPYRLSLRADLNWGSISSNGQKRTVGLVNADGSTRAINPKLDTWVLIHGWNGQPADLANLSTAIDGYTKKDQVLALDWSSAAAEPTAFQASAWVTPAAQFAAKALSRWGIATDRIHLAGHSLGGWIANDLAELVPGGVNRIIAMDPATDLPGIFISGVNYAANSRYSTAFMGSSYGTEEAAATAHQTFKVNVGPWDSIISHMFVPTLVASIFAANNTSAPDSISSLFAIDKLNPSVVQLWKTNAYAKGYEGTIVGRQNGLDWLPQTLNYISATTGKKVSIQA